MCVWGKHHHSSLDMNVNAVHVRDIRILDQTLWRLQSLAVELEVNNPLSIEFETSSRCIDHLDKSCALWISSVRRSERVD